MEYVTFDVVDIYYPYSCIFGRGFTNKFRAIFHSTYLCVKMTALQGVVPVFGNPKEDKEIERKASRVNEM